MCHIGTACTTLKQIKNEKLERKNQQKKIENN